jgi:hypothetical protein
LTDLFPPLCVEKSLPCAGKAADFLLGPVDTTGTIHLLALVAPCRNKFFCFTPVKWPKLFLPVTKITHNLRDSPRVNKPLARLRKLFLPGTKTAQNGNGFHRANTL